MARIMNLFASRKPQNSYSADSVFEQFLSACVQTRITYGVSPPRLWLRERGYWLAYMFQLAFSSGAVVRDTSDVRYYWQTESGVHYDGLGQIHGVSTQKVDAVPELYSNLRPEEFVNRFLFDNATMPEVKGLQSMFREQYSWYFAHFIAKSWGHGEVYILVSSDGGLHPVCVDKEEGCFFDIACYGEVSSERCIKESEFGQAIDYFKGLPGVSEKFEQEVRNIVQRRLR